MSIFSKPGIRKTQFKCPNPGCTDYLVPEELADKTELTKSIAFNAAYQSIFLTRGERYVCRTCKKEGRPYKFKLNLLGKIRDNWFLTDAMRKARKK